jgi:glutathione peroxidase
MEKIDVNGSQTHPIYEFLKKQQPGLLGIQMIKWNFEKFLVDRDGNVVKRYSSMTTPEAIESDILKLL